MNDETKRLVDEAEKRANEATPGPWLSMNQFGKLRIAPASKPYDPEAAICGHYGIRPKTAEFIAHAREDVPALCAIIREQDTRLQNLGKRLQSRSEAAKAWGALAVDRLGIIHDQCDQIEAQDKRIQELEECVKQLDSYRESMIDHPMD